MKPCLDCATAVAVDSRGFQAWNTGERFTSCCKEGWHRPGELFGCTVIHHSSPPFSTIINYYQTTIRRRHQFTISNHLATTGGKGQHGALHSCSKKTPFGADRNWSPMGVPHGYGEKVPSPTVPRCPRMDRRPCVLE